MFRIDSLDISGEFVGVRVWAGPPDARTNCGVLVFTLDEWLEFHALLAGRSDVVEFETRGFDEIRRELNGTSDEADPGSDQL